MRTDTALGWIAVAALGIACGGSPQEQPPPGASIESEQAAGDEQPSDESEAMEDEAEPTGSTEAPPIADRAQGPATIVVDVQVKGQPVAAEVQILRDGEPVENGPSGQPITTESGDYTMIVAVKDGLADKPVQRRDLTLMAGQNVRETVTFPWAMVQLKVMINGRVAHGAVVDIVRDGEVIATLKGGAPHTLISPGRYSAVVKARGAKIEVESIMFPAEATQTVPVNVRM